MKKNLIIAVLALVSLFSIAFGFQQKAEADKQKQIAEENARLAQQAQAEVERLKQSIAESVRLAQQARAEAQLQFAIANELAKKSIP